MVDKTYTKTLKTTHDNIKKYIDTNRKTTGLAALLPDGMLLNMYQLDFTEIRDIGRPDQFEETGQQKVSQDILEARLAKDGIATQMKFSNTIKKLMFYMTKYYPSGCGSPFEGFIRLSTPVDCSPVVLDDDSDLCKQEDYKYISDMMDKYLPQLVELMQDLPEGTHMKPYNDSFTLTMTDYWSYEFGQATVNDDGKGEFIPVVKVYSLFPNPDISKAPITCEYVVNEYQDPDNCNPFNDKTFAQKLNKISWDFGRDMLKMPNNKYYASEFTVYNDNKFRQGKVQKVNNKVIFVNKYKDKKDVCEPVN